MRCTGIGARICCFVVVSNAGACAEQGIEKVRDFTTFWGLFGAVRRLEKTKGEKNKERVGARIRLRTDQTGDNRRPKSSKWNRCAYSEPNGINRE